MNEPGTTGQSLQAWVVQDENFAVSSSTWGGSFNGTTSGATAHYEFNTPHVGAEFIGFRNSKNQISARLYFRYVKRNLNIIEMNRFKSRLKRLEKMADEFEKLGQIAMGEECIKQFIVLSRESAMWACGIKLFITQEQATRFSHCIKGETLKITPLKNFVRIIPPDIVKKVKACVNKKLFDEYVIFHLDNKAIKETEKEKIKREKDPIIFGKISETDKYYFIGDWEDELDNLRLTDIVKELSIDKKEMGIKQHIDMKKEKDKMLKGGEK